MIVSFLSAGNVFFRGGRGNCPERETGLLQSSVTFFLDAHWNLPEKDSMSSELKTVLLKEEGGGTKK